MALLPGIAGTECNVLSVCVLHINVSSDLVETITVKPETLMNLANLNEFAKV